MEHLEEIQLIEKYNKDPILWQSKGNFLIARKHQRHSYFYSERKGEDSVAFLIRYQNEIYGITERKIPLDVLYGESVMLFSALGGSIDKDIATYLKLKYENKNIIPNENMLDILKKIVIEEAIEESGFIVTFENVKYVDTVMVSTQSNQLCHLFLAEAHDLGEKQPENPMEALAYNTNIKDAKNKCWKANMIINNI